MSISKKLLQIRKHIVHSYVRLENLLEVRNDLFIFYNEGVKSLIENKKTKRFFKGSSYYWYQKAIEFSEYAINFDPHKNVIKKMNELEANIDLIDRLNSFIKFISTLIFLIFFSGSGYVFIIDWPYKYEFTTLAILLVFLPKIYRLFLSLDTETIQVTNKELVFDKHYLEKSNRKKDELIAAYIWNKSLCKYNSILILTIFVGIRCVSKKMYGFIMRKLTDVIYEYVPTYVENKSKLDYCKYLLRLTKDGKFKY